VKTALECMACYLRQTLQVSRVATEDESKHLRAVQRVSELIATMDMDKTPPENSVPVYRTISEITDCADPYFEIKKQSNEQAISVLPEFKKKIVESGDPLATALRIAIGGNIIDYGAMHSFDVDVAMERCLKAPFSIDHSQNLLQNLRSLEKGAKLLYLADNSGEIVYDSLVITELADMGLDVTVVVKSGPIINDALMADARACGIDRIARVLENGTSCPGTPLADCSTELLRAFNEADLIISKGQGNFETLSESEAEIYFLLTVKCSVVGAHLAEISNTPQQELSGKGELVLFHYNGKLDA
jgi:damage-control phosphatase, subfamily I